MYYNCLEFSHSRRLASSTYMAKIRIKSTKLTPFGKEYFNREQLLTIFRTNQHLLSGVKKHIEMCEGKECELQHCNMRMDK